VIVWLGGDKQQFIYFQFWWYFKWFY